MQQQSKECLEKISELFSGQHLEHSIFKSKSFGNTTDTDLINITDKIYRAIVATGVEHFNHYCHEFSEVEMQRRLRKIPSMYRSFFIEPLTTHGVNDIRQLETEAHLILHGFGAISELEEIPRITKITIDELMISVSSNSSLLLRPDGTPRGLTLEYYAT